MIATTIGTMMKNDDDRDNDLDNDEEEGADGLSLRHGAATAMITDSLVDYRCLDHCPDRRRLRTFLITVILQSINERMPTESGRTKGRMPVKEEPAHTFAVAESRTKYGV